MIELFSLEHFERAISNKAKGRLGPEKTKKIASFCRYLFLSGFEDGQLGKPMERHTESKELNRAERKLARDYYKLYKQGYELGKQVM